MGDRYFWFQLVSFDSDNFGSVGKRVTGSKAASFALIGPHWKGTLPEGVIELPPSRTDIAFILARTLVDDVADGLIVEAARLTALQGAEILLNPKAIGWHPSEKARDGARQHAAWETIQRAHAIANGCYVAAVNRVGLQRPAGGDGLEFWGQSFVAGPSGDILARASADREQTLLVELNLGQLDATRVHWPFLRDRRIDAYGPITQRFLD